MSGGIWIRGGLALLAALAAVLLALPAEADPARAYCGRSVSGRERPLPASLHDLAVKALGIDASVRTGLSYRCARGKLLVCSVGANLSCGRANTDKNPRAVAAYCRENPDTDVVPMVVTGHDTIYNWSCVHGAPKLQPPSTAVDADGYLADNWREIE